MLPRHGFVLLIHEAQHCSNSIIDEEDSITKLFQTLPSALRNTGALSSKVQNERTALNIFA